MIQDFLRAVQTRLNRKLRKAEDAFVTRHFVKEPENCLNGGRVLTDTTCVCKIHAWGNNEAEAHQCWREKAALCPKFEPRFSEAKLRAKFRSLKDIDLRNPSINELRWVVETLQAYINKEAAENQSFEVNETNV